MLYTTEEVDFILGQHHLWLNTEGREGKKADLHKADLSARDLSGRDLSDINFFRANFTEADLTGVNFSDANLTEADLSRAILKDVNFSNANLSSAHIYKSDLTGASLEKANLSKAEIIKSNLSRCDLSNARLLGAKLTKSNLFGADLSGTYLSGADLSKVNLNKAKLLATNLTGANISGAGLEEIMIDAFTFNQLTHELVAEYIDSFKLTQIESEGITDDPYGKSTFYRELQIPIEYQQPIVSLITYLQFFINHRHPGIEVEITIVQSKYKVKTIIEVPSGLKKDVGESLYLFSKVVLGKLHPEDVLTNSIHIQKLKNKLKISQIELRQIKQLLDMKKGDKTTALKNLEDSFFWVVANIGEKFMKKSDE